MKLRSTFLRPSRAYAAAPIGDLTGPSRGEAGVDGDPWINQWYGGGPDVNPELTGSAKFDVYDEMAKTDPSIKSLLLFIGLPIRSAVWGLNPRDENDPTCRVIRDNVAWNLGLEGEDGQLDLSWKETLQQGLSILKVGPCFEELVWDDVREWRDQDGDPHLVRPLARLALRPARTIQHVKRDRGRLVEVTQNVPGARPIPGDKLSYLIFEREDNRWDGVSLLRPAWGAFMLKKEIMISYGIGWDRFSFGIPAIWHPDNPEDEARARRMGRAMRGHERAYLRFPSEGPSTSGAGRPDSQWWVELLNGAATLADPVPFLKWLAEQQAEAGLQQFSKLGMTDTGSRAVGQVQIDPFFLAVQELADYLRRERARQVIRKIVEVNFGREAAERQSPVLTVSKIQARNVEVTARAISLLDAAGFHFTDRGAQDDVREMLGFGPLPDDLMDAAGVTPAQVQDALRAAGVDQATFAAVIAGLPDTLGVARNRVGKEGDGLAIVRANSERRRLEEEARERVERAERHLDERLDEFERLIRERPDPKAPVEIHFPAQTTDPEIVAAINKLAERELPATVINVAAPDLPAPAEQPIHLEVHVDGEQRPRQATIEKLEDGRTIVHYTNGEEQ